MNTKTWVARSFLLTLALVIGCLIVPYWEWAVVPTGVVFGIVFFMYAVYWSLEHSGWFS